jgi:mannose-6-phosphate isomerase-like protein (cupin superfamily)
MHILSRDTVTPLVSQHGEIISELIGRADRSSQRHSVAYIAIPPGKSSVLHYHPVTEESYHILQGKARMVVGDEEAILAPGQSVLIPPQTPHRITNIGEIDLAFLAFCVPAWEPSCEVPVAQERS